MVSTIRNLNPQSLKTKIQIAVGLEKLSIAKETQLSCFAISKQIPFNPPPESPEIPQHCSQFNVYLHLNSTLP
jgi:hypothetical protein